MNFITVPMRSLDHKSDQLLIIIGPENVERMKRADPLQVDVGKMARVELVNPKIVIAYEEQSPELNRLIQTNDIRGLLEFVQRGFEFRPDLGDNDGPYRRIENEN